jgi:hypothetical protein
MGRTHERRLRNPWEAILGEEDCGQGRACEPKGSLDHNSDEATITGHGCGAVKASMISLTNQFLAQFCVATIGGGKRLKIFNWRTE